MCLLKKKKGQYPLNEIQIQSREARTSKKIEGGSGAKEE